MTGIRTNTAAMSALHTLRSISGSLEKTQNQISSGYRVATASDNAAYWSISTTMRSDNKANAAVSDSIGLAQAIVDVAYPALETVKNSLVELRNLAIQVENLDPPFSSGLSIVAPGANGKRVIDNFDPNWQVTYAGTTLMKLDTAAAQYLDAARDAMNSASFNGVNLLIKDDNGKSLSDVMSSFVVGYGTGRVQTLDLKGSDLVLLNKGRQVSNTNEDGLLDGLTWFMVPDGSGGETKTWWGNWTLFSARQGTGFNDVRSSGVLFDLALGMPNQSGLGLDRKQAYDVWMNNLTEQIEKVTSVMARVGTVQSSLQRYAELNQSRMDVISKGIGRLVDADMDEASTRLKALQSQQQLGIQALSIANSNADNIMQLFR